MNSSHSLFLTLLAVQLCGLCLAGVLPDSLETKVLRRDSSEEQDELANWDKTATDDKLRHLSEEVDDKLETEEQKSTETEEDNGILRPVRSPTLVGAGLQFDLDSDSVDDGDDFKKDDEGKLDISGEQDNEEEAPEDANEEDNTLTSK